MDILDLINRGSQTVESLNRSECLRDAAESFLGIFSTFEGFGVVAASPQAERVLGAAMILRPDLHSGSGGRTVILDVNIASGTMLAQAARRLREAGNVDELIGVALHALTERETEWVLPDLSQLIVADRPAARHSRGWERPESRDHCIVLAS